jgi:predicted O-methyltransferase YrrM
VEDRRHPGDGGIWGYSYPEQVRWLADRARDRYSILELGAWLGRCTDALATATRGGVTVVDSWAGGSDPDDEVNAFQGDEAFAAYQRNVAHHRNILTLRMTSAEAWRRLGHASFDMVWIDADHTYERVREDILMWRALLRPGGLLCGHDGEYPGVSRAVHELVPAAQHFQTCESVIWWTEAA